MALFIKLVPRYHKSGDKWHCSVELPFQMIVKTNGPVTVGKKVRSQYNGSIEIKVGDKITIHGDVKDTKLRALESVRTKLVKSGLRMAMVAA